jgi:hypothetical protein
MARSFAQQQEIADLLTAPGTDMCELGCGPGALAAMLARGIRSFVCIWSTHPRSCAVKHLGAAAPG